MNLELLKTILQDFSAEELDAEIFTLNEVSIATSAKDPTTTKSIRKSNVQTMQE
jgi:hypothetical protein